ncbi:MULTISPECIES: PilZ domain-containing protein [unclassified Sulfurospirillum]|uniref:PilZ domain-containing protein n=1 Tax=unclassified Sulfurospirillum TaxID=2618290 RepID=UPI000502E430|nr:MULTISPECIES: PilZ domain-containing protein [unclassified Sulfurospirillum]KFL33411.1 pilus assembly protein PilZ [Sulfurospirillum sp. SCADC]
MEKEVISFSDKEKFLAASALFLKECELSFAEYFTCLCVHYDKTMSKDEAKEIALSIYHGLFKRDSDIEEIREDLFVRMRHDSVMIGFLINRSLFYLIENYLSFARKQAIDPQVELLIGCVSHFITLLESNVTPKVCNPTAAFDVSFSSDVMFTPTNNIIEAFHTMRDDHQSVTFLNLYKGVPISSEASIVDIEGEQVAFRIDQLQEIAMKLDGQAFIVKNNYFNKHLKADIVYSDFQNNTVVLKNFIYLLNMPALQREFIRVHPDIIANVYLHQFGNMQTIGRLYDLSMNGLGVVSSENNGIFVGAKVLVEFELNSASISMDGDKKIAVQGEVINVIEYKDSYRYCMRILPNREMSEKILHYITKREREILEDLRNELNEYRV